MRAAARRGVIQSAEDIVSYGTITPQGFVEADPLPDNRLEPSAGAMPSRLNSIR
jgi:hypothetical protein